MTIETKAVIKNGKQLKVSISELCEKVKNGKIIKGVRQYNGATTITYIVDESISRKYDINKEICISKKSNFKKTYFKFVTWGTVTITNGSIQSGNTNMLNDNKKYDIYVREV